MALWLRSLLGFGKVFSIDEVAVLIETNSERQGAAAVPKTLAPRAQAPAPAVNVVRDLENP